MKGESYQEVGNFSQDNLVKSPNFPELKLTVAEIFQGIS
ncbi:hypothetical protein cce_0026 [Crocosphaera subtropica ATCC 51142]|uniref:Uncharacterized protein n=1 Tax=Crocosphaera subtropica (strain ATCC 51142 / BH68) TaxID=43989 RepID=B1WYE8_CROS5|nr:hypothetical protein cce_0026 [Crocosphaera subtropica ATCC 51142]